MKLKRWMWPLAVILALVGLIVLLKRCEPEPAVREVAGPPVKTVQAVSSTATSSTKATNKAKVKVTVPANSKGRYAASGKPVEQDEPVTVEVELDQEAVAQAAAVSSASQTVFGQGTSVGQPDYARVGVLLGSFPGLAAVDVQVVRAELPSWLLGQRLDLGLDLEANHLQAGAGVSVGGKFFVTGGGCVTYLGLLPSYYLGVGARF